jgi:signal transduction histidine kinase
MYLKKSISRLISIVLINAFLLSGVVFADASGFALAPPLATKPPCQIIYNEKTNTWDVITDEILIKSWDREAVDSYYRGIAVSGEAFRNRWAFVDISFLMGQMLKLTQEHKIQHPTEILKPLMWKHINRRNGKAEILLEGYDINGVEEIREGDTITGLSIPVKRSGELAYRLIYSLKSGDTAITMSDRTTVWVTTDIYDYDSIIEYANRVLAYFEEHNTITQEQYDCLKKYAENVKVHFDSEKDVELFRAHSSDGVIAHAIKVIALGAELIKTRADVKEPSSETLAIRSLHKNGFIAHELGHLLKPLHMVSMTCEEFLPPEIRNYALEKRISEWCDEFNLLCIYAGASHNEDAGVLTEYANRFIRVMEAGPSLMREAIQFLKDNKDKAKENVEKLYESAVAGFESVQSIIYLIDKVKGSMSSATGRIALNINDIIRNVAQVVIEPYTRKAGFKLELELDNEIQEAMFTADIWFVFTNMITNAVDAILANKKNGERIITIKSKYDRHQRQIVISVGDTGIGIKQENVGRIWDKYFTTKKDGTGLGLYYTKEIVGKNSGTIEVDSLTEEEYSNYNCTYKDEGRLEDAMQKRPEVQEAVRKLYGYAENYLSRFEQIYKILTASPITYENWGKFYSAFQTDVVPAFERFRSDLERITYETQSPSLFSLHHYPAQSFQKLFGIDDKVVHMKSEDRHTYFVEKQEYIHSTLQEYERSVAWFKRLAEGRRITPGTTFTFRLPVASEPSSGQARRLSEATQVTQLEPPIPVSKLLNNMLEDSKTRAYLVRHHPLYLPAYMKAFEQFQYKARRFLDAGKDAVAIELENGNVLKISLLNFDFRPFEPNFDAPQLEQGVFTVTMGGKEIKVYYLIQPKLEMSATIEDVERFAEQIRPNDLLDKNEGAIGFDRKSGRWLLVDTFAVEKRYGRLDRNILSSTNNAVSALESEQVHRDRLADTLKVIQAKQTELVIIALGTSWIKGYEEGRYLQHDAINPLLSNLRNCREFERAQFIIEDDKNLAAAIQVKMGEKGFEGARVIALAGEETINKDLAALDNGKNILMGVDSTYLTVDSYIRLMEMLKIASKLAINPDMPPESPNIPIEKRGKFWVFIPRAEPMNYETLKAIYEVQRFA